MTPARCAIVTIASTTAAAVSVAVLLPAAAAGSEAIASGTIGATPFPDLLVWGCAAVGVVATCWLWLVSCVVVLDASRGVATARVGVPDPLRRAVLVLCGTAITAGLAAPATAGGTTPPPDLPHALSGLRLPERVEVMPRPGHRGDSSAPVSPATQPHTVVVEPGDTLWAIAAAHLGEGATDSETAGAWPALYELNKDLIGPDPGRITPGQQLELPTFGHDGAGR